MSATRLRLSPSLPLAASIATFHAAAAVSAWLTVPAPIGALLGVSLLGLGLAGSWGRALLKSPGSTRSLELGGGPGLVVELANGERFEAEAGKRRYVTALLVVLPLRSRKPGGPRRTLLVTRDMLDPRSFRTLRIWALWGRLPGAAAPSGVAGAQLQL